MSNTDFSARPPVRLAVRERARRFWSAHARSRAHLTILYAFANNPALEWTPEGLSNWYGVRLDVVGTVLEELVAAGIVLDCDHSWAAFRWNDRHRWAEPTTATVRRVVADRWRSLLTSPGTTRTRRDRDIVPGRRRRSPAADQPGRAAPTYASQSIER